MMAKKGKEDPPPPPPKKGILARLQRAADKQADARQAAQGRRLGQSNKAQGKDHSVQEDPVKQMARAHQTFLTDDKHRPYAYVNCYCKVYDSDHLRGG